MTALPQTIHEAAERLRRRETSSRELTDAYLERIGALDGGIHAYLTLDEAGNTELRTWLVAMGMTGQDRPFELLTYQPTWHHGYAVGYWT